MEVRDGVAHYHHHHHPLNSSTIPSVLGIPIYIEREDKDGKNGVIEEEDKHPTRY